MPETSPDLMETLRRYWGYHEFRPRQESIIRSLLAGRDTCVVMPTGGGKSLCYQLPAVVSGKTTVVVSPLIALMQD
jgi:ATP-dependent DNA helicase RecQ